MLPLRDNIRSRTWPVVNVFFILTNLAVFAYEVTRPDLPSVLHLMELWGVVPARLRAAPWADAPTILTGMFLHGGWSHVLSNMLYLWIFGDNVEDRLGHFRYLVFYLLVGTAATLAQVSLHPESRIPLVGASGAIAGVLGAYFMLYPRAKIVALIPVWVFLRVAEVPALFFLGFWFLLQAVQSWGSITQRAVQGDVGGIAWGAHAGGFIAGSFLVWFFKKKGRR